MVRVLSSVTNMDNLEEVLDALNDFQKKLPKDCPPLLNDYLCHVAKTGETLFPWSRLKSFFRAKLDDVMTQYNADLPSDHLVTSPNVENAKFEEMRNRILSAFEKFHGAPFTVQRLCELITEPQRHYKRTDKFLRGIEKNVLVVGTVDPFGRKIVSDSPKNLVNGLDANGEEVVKDEESSTVVPPVISWSTDEVAANWPTQSSDSNSQAETMPEHNGEGDCSSETIPSQSSDTSIITSHPKGEGSFSSDSSSREETPTTSQDNTNIKPDDSQSPDNVTDQSESSAADHVSSINTDTSCIHSPSSPEKSVEISTSDIPVEIMTSSDIPVEIATSDIPVSDPVVETSSSDDCQNSVELTTITLTEEANSESEESVSTTEKEICPSNTSVDIPKEPTDITEAAVTSSESTFNESKALDTPSCEDTITEDISVSQSNNVTISDNFTQHTSSNSSTDNVTSSDCSENIEEVEKMESDVDNNEVSSEQTVITESGNKSEIKSEIQTNVTQSDNSESTVSRSEEPMEQD